MTLTGMVEMVQGRKVQHPKKQGCEVADATNTRHLRAGYHVFTNEAVTHVTVTLSSVNATMPEKVVETAYPVIDSDPHAYRVVRYMRPSDFGAWAAVTAAFPAAFFAWGTGYSVSSATSEVFMILQRWQTLPQ